MKNRTLFAGMLFFVFFTAAFAETIFPSDLEARGKYLTIKIAVAGPGDEL
jgi:hypothetical protein